MPDPSSPLQIVLAGPQDAEPIAELSKVAIEHDLPWRWTPPRVMRCIADPTVNVIVARLHGQRAGFALMKYEERDAHLWLFAVEEQWRRQGVGTALLGWLQTTVRVAGIGTIHLEARVRNEGARAFYRQLGFVEQEQVARRYLGVEDGIRMIKVIGTEPAQSETTRPGRTPDADPGG